MIRVKYRSATDELKERQFKRTVEYQLIKEFGNDWYSCLDVILYEYIVLSTQGGQDVDGYRQLINDYVKCQHHDHITLYKVALSALIDTLKTFQDHTCSMKLDDHFTFTAALEYMAEVVRINNT